MWERLDVSSIERLVLTEAGGVMVANSTVIGLEGDNPFQVSYAVEVDEPGQLRRVSAGTYSLTYHGSGQWRGSSGNMLPQFDGCTSIDIVETPFTNTLAIKQLQLQPGESGEITVAWFHLAEGTWHPDRQRYTCLEKTDQGSMYRFEQLSSGFVAVLPFDKHDLVIDYPDLYRRLYPKESDRK